MDKNILEQMVNGGLSSYKIASQTGKSKSTIRYWLNKYELNTNRIYKCTKCGETNSENFSVGRFSVCKKCRGYDQTACDRTRKKTFIEYKGGKCIRCGYNKCIAALDFHHRNPLEKDPNWKKMKKRKFETVKKELDKCDLVCRNCHSEIHYDIISV